MLRKTKLALRASNTGTNYIDSVGDKLISIVRKDFMARLLNTAFVILIVESAINGLVHKSGDEKA